MRYELRDYSTADAMGVLAVFNHFVEHDFAAYPTVKVGMEFPGRLEQVQRDGYPVITVRDEDGIVLGFGLLRAYHPAGSFRRTGEVGYFLHPSVTGLGIGSVLLERLLERGRAMGLRTVLASISSRNEQSLAFHRKHGFEEVGRFRGIGEKFGQDFDVVYMQRAIGGVVEAADEEPPGPRTA